MFIETNDRGQNRKGCFGYEEQMKDNRIILNKW